MGSATSVPKRAIDILKFQDSRTSSELIRVLKKNEIFKQLAVRFLHFFVFSTRRRRQMYLNRTPFSI